MVNKKIINNNKLSSGIIVSIITILIFEYLRSLVNFSTDLFSNILMSFTLIFLLIQINRDKLKLQNLGIIGIIIVLLEIIRVENTTFTYTNYIIISLIEYGFLSILTSKKNLKKK